MYDSFFSFATLLVTLVGDGNSKFVDEKFNNGDGRLRLYELSNKDDDDEFALIKLGAVVVVLVVVESQEGLGPGSTIEINSDELEMINKAFEYRH